MGEAKRRAKEIAEGKYKGRAKDLPKNQLEPKVYRVLRPETSQRELDRMIKEDEAEAEAVHLINPEREVKK